MSVMWKEKEVELREPPSFALTGVGDAELLRICALIPAKDERLGIVRTLESIIAANMPPFDIYVCDDGSRDDTGNIARSYGVNVLRNEQNVGKASAIARTAEYFDLLDRYHVIALMDADTAVCPGYYDAVRNGFKSADIVAVCGRPQSLPHNWLTAYRCYSYFMTHAVYRSGQTALGVITVAPGCSTSFRTSAFRQLEWCSDTIVEDMDCTIQMYKKNLGRIVYQESAIVYTQDPKSIRDYIKQTNRWYTGAWQVGKKHRMFKSLSKIDLEYKLLLGEALMFAVLLCLLPLWVYLVPQKMAAFIIINTILLMLISILAGWDSRRIDVVLFSPMFVLLQTLDLFILLRSFWRTVVRSQDDHAWNQCARY
ncbi:MAG: glycosyltransferase family 2 protein [Acidobacteria bacterium]|nr:glycosyltransferase family 2 protein [Acidobacteriota bacterium]